MTEKSYFFDGATTGDAQLAPYDADLFSDVLYKLFGSELSFVFPADITYLQVNTTGANMIITVKAGNALVQGRYFTCTDTTFTVPSNTSTLPRIDRVVVRIDKDNHNGTLALKQGVPGYAPEPAFIQQDDTIYEFPVARIYVPSGIAALFNYHVIDEREFFGVKHATSLYESNNENIMPNSEFIAGAGTSYDTAPACWWAVNTGTCVANPKFAQQARGSSIKVTCPLSGDGIATAVDRLSGTAALHTVTLRLLIQVSSGIVTINTGGGSSGHLIPATGGVIEFIERRSMTNAFSTLAVSITATTNNTEFILGQVTLAEGFTGAPYLPKKELILFGKPVTQLAYPTNFLAPATTEYDLVSDLDGVSSLITRLDVSDGSSGTNNTNFASLQDIANDADQLRVEIGRLTNAGISGAQGFIGAPYDANGDQKLQLQVTNVATTSVGVYHLGCIT